MRVPILKDSREIGIMREAGRIVARGLALLSEAVRPGVSTGELDGLFEKHVRDAGAVPTFKGYRGYKASLCTSINEEVVHGIPSRERILKEGDLLSLDAGATYRGYVGDSAVTVPVGKVSREARQLLDVTRRSLDAAIEAVRPGGTLADVGRAIQALAEQHGYGIVRDYGGHGVGRDLHEEPHVPNYVDPSQRSLMEYVLQPGLCIAIEPMLCQGTHEVKVLRDRWTVVTLDGKLSAHFEHSVAVTRDGREVLTLP
jgi:methionyl aminopeptidase